jgi:hypothetical protein
MAPMFDSFFYSFTHLPTEQIPGSVRSSGNKEVTQIDRVSLLMTLKCKKWTLTKKSLK